MQRGEGDQIKLKRYFYALRAAMALRWIETREDLPPMNFHALMAGVVIPADVFAEIQHLLEIKTSTAELGTGDRIAVLERFLERQIQWAKAQSEKRVKPETLAENRTNANALFRGIVRQAWV